MAARSEADCRAAVPWRSYLPVSAARLAAVIRSAAAWASRRCWPATATRTAAETPAADSSPHHHPPPHRPPVTLLLPLLPPVLRVLISALWAAVRPRRWRVEGAVGSAAAETAEERARRRRRLLLLLMLLRLHGPRLRRECQTWRQIGGHNSALCRCDCDLCVWHSDSDKPSQHPHRQCGITLTLLAAQSSSYACPQLCASHRLAPGACLTTVPLARVAVCTRCCGYAAHWAQSNVELRRSATSCSIQTASLALVYFVKVWLN